MDFIAISIHAPREGSDRIPPRSVLLVDISIHAPREGSDLIPVVFDDIGEISIHAPREGSDQAHREVRTGVLYFNPRSP